MQRSLALVLAGVLLCAACRRGSRAEKGNGLLAPASSASAGASANGGATAASLGRLAKPPSMRELPTTDPALAKNNLDAQVASAEERTQRDPSNVDARAAFVSLLLARGQSFGRIADYERAADVAEQALASKPSGSAYLARASVRSTFHRFADALSDLALAAPLGVPEWRVDTARASIFQALGQYDEAFAIRHRLSQRQPNLQTLGAEAVLLTERGDESRGDFDNAAQLFADAEARFADVSPFPLAWLWLEKSVLEEKWGHAASARTWLEAARERMPEYEHVVSHLAALEPPRRAAELLQPLLSSSDDPEVAAQLSAALAALGRDDEAARLRERAAARYRDLTARYPDAFADHAARFWLGAGADPKLALGLARHNVEVRKTNAAYELLVEAALAAGSPDVACDGADAAFAAHEWRPSELLRTFAATAYAACPSRARRTP
jgi:tetratricopeptide (TPR) repeat protein